MRMVNQETDYTKKTKSSYEKSITWKQQTVFATVLQISLGKKES